MPEPLPPPLPDPGPVPPPLPTSRPVSLWQQSVELHDDIEDGVQGIGGWLILVAISMVASIPMLALRLLSKWNVFFARPGVWSALTPPGSRAYRPWWSTVIIYETAGNAIRLMCAIGLAVLFFRHRKIFKPLMIVFLIASVFYFWGDYFLYQQIRGIGSPPQIPFISTLVGYTAGSLIWIAYLVASQRVKNTFVR